MRATEPHERPAGDLVKVWFTFAAFDVPADADFPAIKQALADGRSKGWWHFEVGCDTDRWRNSGTPR
ncbi:DUF4265 domain-containing protein [Actinoplanes sp. CA-054009]